MKYAYDPSGVEPYRLANYAQFCGWNLARAHAKSGDAAAIAGYLGKSDTFDRAIVSFARRLRGAEPPRLRGLPHGRRERADRGRRPGSRPLSTVRGRRGRVPPPPHPGAWRSPGPGSLEAEVPADRAHERAGCPPICHREDEDAAAGRAGLPVTDDLRRGDAHEPVAAAAPPHGGDRGPDGFCGATVGAEPGRGRGPDRVRDPDRPAEGAGEARGEGVEGGPAPEAGPRARAGSTATW